MNAPDAAIADRLKLIARDPTDLTVLSACLQDALAPISDIAWFQDEKRLAFAVNRFMWERTAEESDGAVYHRTHALVRIEGVTGVKSRGYDRRDRARILSILSLRPVEEGVDILFADGAMIRAESAEMSVSLIDMGDPWPTRWRPDHPDE